MPDKNLRIVFDSTKTIRDISNHLLSLSASFEDTGNTKMSEKLFEIANELMSCQKKITSGVSGYIRDELHESQAQIGKIFSTLAEKE